MRIAAMCLLIGSMIGFAAAGGGPAEPQDLAGELAQLRTERRDVLRERVEVLQAMVRQGRESTVAFLHAQNDLLKAEIEMATDPKEEIELRKKHVRHLLSVQDQLRLRHHVGEAAIQDVMLARSETLKAEIELLEARSAN